MTKNFAEELVKLVAKTRFSDFCISTIHKAKMHLLDTLGAALAGSTSYEYEAAICLVHTIDKKQGVPIWGRSFYTGAQDSALLNGIAAHAYELDDCGGCDHSGAVVVPTILALLPQLPTDFSGENLLTNMILGYEVARRILEASGGYETHNDLGWHSTGTCGVFGAAIAASLTLDLDEIQILNALGIAGSYAGGTWNFIHDGSQTKKLHAGLAASGGVASALLARVNFQGPTNILQPASWGSYLSTFAQDKGCAQNLIENFGQNWRINRCSIKPYATCRGTHSAIDALDWILDHHHLDKNSIVAIDARMSTFQANMCGGKVVKTRAQAQKSLAYALAARLTYGKVFLQELEEEAYKSDEVKSWLKRITIISDDTMKQADEPEITLITTNNERFSACVAYPLGSPQSPLSDEKIIEKFIHLSDHILSVSQIDTIIDSVLTIDRFPDVRDFVHSLSSHDQLSNTLSL